MAEPLKSPTVDEETERLRKWREVRRQAAANPQTDRLANAALDREKRLEMFEQDKSRRIREAEERRRAEAEALENRRMEKARAHLDALDDIETAKARLLGARKRARRLAMAALFLCVGLPTLATALWTAYVATPVYQSTSILALPAATPINQRNPLLNDMTVSSASGMAPAYQMRAELAAMTSAVDYDMAINMQQGLITLAARADSGLAAAGLNQRIIAKAKMIAPGLTTLAYPSTPDIPLSRTFSNSLLAFLTSLSIFAISIIFVQSLLHHSRN